MLKYLMLSGFRLITSQIAILLSRYVLSFVKQTPLVVQSVPLKILTHVFQAEFFAGNFIYKEGQFPVYVLETTYKEP